MIAGEAVPHFYHTLAVKPFDIGVTVPLLVGAVLRMCRSMLHLISGTHSATQQHGAFHPAPGLVPPHLFAPTLEASNYLFGPVVRAWHLPSLQCQAVALPAVMQMLDDLPQLPHWRRLVIACCSFWELGPQLQQPLCAIWRQRAHQLPDLIDHRLPS